MTPAPAPEKEVGAAGPLIGLVSAASFGLMTVLARLAYDGGSEPFTVTAIRAVVGVLAILAVTPVFRQGLAVPRQAMPTLFAIMLCRFAASISIMTAIYFIPVSLAVLLLYTYPLMVAGASSAINRTPLGWKRWAAFAVAFAGLALTLGPALDGIDWRGVALALFTAVNIAAMLIISATAIRQTNVMTISFHTNLWAVPLFFIALAISGEFVLPTVDSGWVGLVGACLFYCIAVLTQFAAVHFVGPIRTAMLFNAEPPITIVAAVLILGESLTPMQYVGGALVIGALVASSRTTRPA
ncbi:MAG: DMT family transporter [Rhodospirillales bacterium]|jgi:drug/metabolite transporter (DMT)-like permease|nr:DMT family transporter [Rhodospirillales bacterium]MDP6774583.1 DMT family transporter [Rhodospirillales bacterium]